MLSEFLKIFLLLHFLFVSTVSLSQNVSVAPADSTTAQDSVLFKKTDSESSVLTQPLLFRDFRSTVVYLNERDSVTHYTYIQRYFTDQFLEIYDSEKILPASRINGFYRDGKYFRAAKVSENNYVFAERNINGYITLYSCDRIYSIGEIDYRSDDTRNPIYQNRQLVLDADRRKIKSQNYDYFITLDFNSAEILPVDIYSFGDTYLKPCKEAYNYYNMHCLRKQDKRTQSVSGAIFGISTVLLFVLSTPGRSTIEENNALNSFGLPLLALSSGVVYLSYSIKNKSRRLTKEHFMKAVTLYNDWKKK